MRTAGAGQHHRPACEAHRDRDPGARDLPEPQGELAGLGEGEGEGAPHSLAAPSPDPGTRRGTGGAVTRRRGRQRPWPQGRAGSQKTPSWASRALERREAGWRAAPGGGAGATAALLWLRRRCGTFRRRPRVSWLFLSQGGREGPGVE